MMKKKLARLGKTVLWLALAMTAAGGGTALAGDYEVGSSSYFFFSKDRNAHSANNFYLPLYEYLNVDVSNLGSPSISIHASGWGRADFTSRGAGDRGDGEFLYGYFQWKDQNSPRRVLRVGRQFIFGGPSSLRSQYVDGLYFKSDLVKGFGVEILGGSPVTSAIGGRGGDVVAQGRAYYVRDDKVEIGVGYLHTLDSNQRAREDFGLDFWFKPIQEVEVFGNLIYDTLGEEVADANLTTVAFPIEKLKLTANFGYAVPSNLLPHTSFFSIFSDSAYVNAGLAGTYFVTDRLTLDADAQFFHYSTGGNLVRYGGQGTYQYGADKQGRVALAAHRLDQLEGGVMEFRTFASYAFKNKLSVSGDLYGYLLDQANRGRDFSFTGIGNVGYEVIKNLNLTGSASYGVNPFFGNDTRGLLKVVYTFGGSTSGS